jgi:hypothetical protein
MEVAMRYFEEGTEVGGQIIEDSGWYIFEGGAWRWEVTGANDPVAGQKQRLEEIRASLRAESVSYGELAELQSLAAHIDPDDVELLEPAGVPETGEGRERQAAAHRRLYS